MFDSPQVQDPNAPRWFDLEFDGRRAYVVPLSAVKARAVAMRLLALIGKSLRESIASKGFHPALQDIITAGYILVRSGQAAAGHHLQRRWARPLAALDDLLHRGELREFFRRVTSAGSDAEGEADGEEREPIPEHIADEWFWHRIATSGRYAERLMDVMHVWTLDMACTAHEYLDFFEKMERRARARAKREADEARRDR
jgi:hypothetical protein